MVLKDCEDENWCVSHIGNLKLKYPITWRIWRLIFVCFFFWFVGIQCLVAMSIKSLINERQTKVMQKYTKQKQKMHWFFVYSDMSARQRRQRSRRNVFNEWKLIVQFKKRIFLILCCKRTFQFTVFIFIFPS